MQLVQINVSEYLYIYSNVSLYVIIISYHQVREGSIEVSYRINMTDEQYTEAKIDAFRRSLQENSTFIISGRGLVVVSHDAKHDGEIIISLMY